MVLTLNQDPFASSNLAMSTKGRKKIKTGVSDD